MDGSFTDMQIRPVLKNYSKATTDKYTCDVCENVEEYARQESNPPHKICSRCHQPHSYKSLLNMKPYVMEYGYVIGGIPCSHCYNVMNDFQDKEIGWEFSCPQCSTYSAFVDLTEFVHVVGKNGRFAETVTDYINLHFHYRSRERLTLFEPKDEKKGNN